MVFLKRFLGNRSKYLFLKSHGNFWVVEVPNQSRIKDELRSSVLFIVCMCVCFLYMYF